MLLLYKLMFSLSGYHHLLNESQVRGVFSFSALKQKKNCNDAISFLQDVVDVVHVAIVQLQADSQLQLSERFRGKGFHSTHHTHIHPPSTPPPLSPCHPTFPSPGFRFKYRPRGRAHSGMRNL